MSARQPQTPARIPSAASARDPRRVAVVTGTRAEFGLLRPVMRAIAAHPDLRLLPIAAGAHLLPPATTIDEVRAEFDLAAIIPMQDPADGAPTRLKDARALGRGVTAFADAFERLRPDWVVVLGDRIEAFAAASAASIGGIPVAHIHGGDRAEGVADEAMRHAITKLAHLHFAATHQSAQRLARLGEPDHRIHTVGSPAIDGLRDVHPLDDAAYAALGSPQAVILMHPIGRTDDEEHAAAAAALRAVAAANLTTLALHPNHDPGRAGTLRAIEEAAAAGFVSATRQLHVKPHLPRETFVGLLLRIRVLVGNSSAGLIEAAAVGNRGVPAVDIGDRQSGRERAANVIHADETEPAVAAAIVRALSLRPPFFHPYGDGRTADRIAAILAATDPHAPGFIRKHNSY